MSYVSSYISDQTRKAFKTPLCQPLTFPTGFESQTTSALTAKISSHDTSSCLMWVSVCVSWIFCHGHAWRRSLAQLNSPTVYTVQLSGAFYRVCHHLSRPPLRVTKFSWNLTLQHCSHPRKSHSTHAIPGISQVHAHECEECYWLTDVELLGAEPWRTDLLLLLLLLRVCFLLDLLWTCPPRGKFLSNGRICGCEAGGAGTAE